MSYIYNLTDTWGAAGTTFAGIKMAVTNTASSASSKLLDLSVSGATTGSFTVDKNGNGVFSGALTLGTPLSVANGGTGLASLTAGYIPFGAGTSALGNSANLFWDNGSSRLGIGTSSPIYNLDLTGEAAFRSSTNSNFSGLNLIRNASDTANPRLIGMLLNGDSESSTTIGAYNAIWGAYDSAPTAGSTSSALNGAMVYGAYAGHRWVTNGTERMRIDSLGNVGIGITAPTLTVAGRVLHVHASAANNAATLRLTTASSGSAQGQGVMIGKWTDDNAYFWHYDAFATVFGTNNAERMRIDNQGNVLIGTSTAGASKLVVNDNSIQINTAKTPASATATGTTGQVCWDSGYIYVCTATNTWKRAAIATW